MSEQLFANGRIAVMSTRMLGADKFARLADCATLSEALHVLNEVSYGAGTTVANPNDYEKVIRAELDIVMKDIKELCCNANALRYLLCKYDYLNAKVLMKGKYMRLDVRDNCFEQATYSPETMRDCFNNDDYSLFGKTMAEACDGIDAEYANGNRSPQVIDRLLDRACFEDMRRFAKRSHSRLITGLCRLEIDSANLLLIDRLKKADYDEEKLKDWTVEGGSVNAQTLSALWQDKITANDLTEQARKIFLSSDAEKELDAQRQALIKAYADPLTVQPALEYFFKKVAETELVRRLLVDIKNGVDKDKIKDNLK